MEENTNEKGTPITEEQLKQICDMLSSRIKPCPKCGKDRKVIAVFEDDDDDVVRGFIQFCEECDENADVPVLDVSELDFKDEFKKSE